MSTRNLFLLLAMCGLCAFGANDAHENMLRTDKFTPVRMHGKTTAIRGIMMHDHARQRYSSKHNKYTSGEGCFILDVNEAGEATFSFPDPLPSPYAENPGETIILEVTVWPLPPSQTYRSTGRVRFEKGNIRLSNGQKFKPSPDWQSFDFKGDAFDIRLTPAAGAKISFADFKMVPVYPKVGGSIALPDGGTLKRIVLPEGADFVTRWGVAMWRGWLWKLTGVALPIETVSELKPSEGDFTPIHDPSLKRGWQLNVTKAGIVLKYNENDDIAPALFDYLRMGMGYAHYAPGCEKLPKLPVASLPAIDRRATPRYDAILHSSNYQLMSGGKMRVNRLMHGETDYYHTNGPKWDHAMNILMPQELYFKDHPEYYMMNTSGTRQVSQEVYNTQQCFSNREARNIILESIGNYANARNGVSRICLEPGDSTVTCQCPQCVAFNGSKSDNTDLLMDFSNEIAAKLKTVGSDMRFIRAAYLNRCNPPKKIKVADNIDIFYCLTEHLLPCTLHVDCERNREHLKLAEIWNRALNNDASRLGYMTYDDARPLQLVRLFEFLNKYGSGDIYMFQWHYTPYSVQFVIPRWNLGEDADKLMEEFDHYYYGKAGDAMHKLTLFIDDYAKNFRHTNNEGRLTVLFCGHPRHARSVFTREAFDRMYAILDEAIAAAGNDKTVRARIFEQKKLIMVEDFTLFGPTTFTTTAESDAFIKRLTAFITMAREAPGKFGGTVPGMDMRNFLLTTAALDIPNTGKFWANEPYVDKFLASPKSFFTDADKIPGGWYFKPLSMKGAEPPSLYSYECPARICVGIRRAGHPNSSATMTLTLKTTPQRSSFLAIEGQDDDKAGTSEMRVTVNGTEIFSGPCMFPERAWGRIGLNVPAGILKEGDNTIVIENITKDTPSRSERFDDPKKAADDLQWGWIALSEAYWLDPNNEFPKYVKGDFTTPWCYNDGNTRSAPPTGIADGRAVFNSEEGPTYYFSHQTPKMAITPGDSVKLTVKASGKGNLILRLWSYRPYRNPSNEQILPSGYAGGGVNISPLTSSQPISLTETPKEYTCVLTPSKGTGLIIPHACADKNSTVELFDFQVEIIPFKQPVGKIAIATNGTSPYSIWHDKEDNDPTMVAAVKDLSEHLKKITGADVPLNDNAAAYRIFVGKRAVGDSKPFTGVRERRIKTVGNDIYLYGDGKFGTIGAVYDFLEKFCGCRWFGPWPGDSLVPSRPTLIMDQIDYSHTPSFHSLELGGAWPLTKVHPGIKDYLRRNRCFLQPDYRGASPSDGWKYIGPTTHGLSAYFPPGGHKPGSFERQWAGPHVALADKAYFKDHPEYFTMNKEGKRVPDLQLCFSNPDVRRILTENLETVLKYEKYNTNDYAIIDLAFNDRSGGFCECPNCKALEKKYQSPGGPYYEYLIELGGKFIEKYPKLVIRMIAYQTSMTGIPPKPGTRFPANISVIVAPLCQDFSKPLSHPYNASYKKEFEDWGRIADKMWWWSYPVLYPHGIRAYALFPGVYRNAENIKFAYSIGTRYIISEMGGSLVHNCAFKKLNDYLQVRLADNVDDSVDRIVKEYCDHCYGPAADMMVKYLRETDRASVNDPNYFIYYDDPRSMCSLHSSNNLVRWQGYFDEMERLIGDNKYQLLQLGRARINLDVLTLLQWNRIRKDRPDFATESKLAYIDKHYADEVEADSQNVWTGKFRNAYSQGWETSLFRSVGHTAYLGERHPAPVPAELVEKYGNGNVTPIRMDVRTQVPARTDEPDAAGGTAIETKINDDQFGYTPCIVEKMPDGTFKRNRPWLIPFKASPLVKKNLPTFKAANGYKPYFVDRIKLAAADTVVVTGVDTKAHFFIADAFDPTHPEQEYDLYISVKYLKDENVLIDRMYVCKALKDK